MQGSYLATYTHAHPWTSQALHRPVASADTACLFLPGGPYPWALFPIHRPLADERLNEVPRGRLQRPQYRLEPTAGGGGSGSGSGSGAGSAEQKAYGASMKLYCTLARTGDVVQTSQEGIVASKAMLAAI